VRRHARTFTLASWFLPPEKRRAVYALYAFCRVVDDLVDESVASGSGEASRQLAEFDRQLESALAGRAAGAVFREVERAVNLFGVPAHVLRALVAGVERDLRPARYRTWLELARYCEGVASTVGEMCTFVFGVPNGDEARVAALRYARTLGVAMQLTNVLRDVGEDARRGRCYLAEDDLASFDLTTGAVLADPALGRDPRWASFMAAQIDRARMLYARATPGIALLSPDSQRCAMACATGYASILTAIEELGYDSISHRATPRGWTRASILWSSWRSRLDRADPSIVGEAPQLEWERLPVSSSDRAMGWA
jgi:phytoene synthase